MSYRSSFTIINFGDVFESNQHVLSHYHFLPESNFSPCLCYCGDHVFLRELNQNGLLMSNDFELCYKGNITLSIFKFQLSLTNIQKTGFLCASDHVIITISVDALNDGLAYIFEHVPCNNRKDGTLENI